jgi:PAS domain S-box-containing protein
VNKPYTVVSRSITFSRVAGVLVMAIGAMVFVGWLFDIPHLKAIHADITMKANTSVSLMLGGLALFLLSSNGEASRRIGLGGAVVCGLIGLLTLSQHVVGWNLHIDQLLFTEQPGALATSSPGRMGVTASSCLVLVGTAMVLLYLNKAHAIARTLIILATAWSLIPIVGYAYRAEQLFSIAQYTGIALHTAISLFVFSLGVLSISIQHGPLSLILDESSAGTLARRLAVVAIVAPLLLGWLILTWQRVSHFESTLATAVLIIAIVIVFLAAIWQAATWFRYAESRRLASETIAREGEEKLRKQREILRVTLSSIGDAVITTDSSGTITFLNPIAHLLTGWGEEAVGKQLTEVFKIRNEITNQPVDNPALTAIKEGVILGLANHTSLSRKDGTDIPIDDSGAPIKDAEGHTIGAVLIFRDVTERRKSERSQALLAGIVESSHDAIVSKSLDGIIQSWNSGAERLFGYKASEVIGKPITIIIPEDRLEEEYEILAKLRRGERTDHFETVRVTKSGQPIFISLTVSPVKNREGEIIGASKIARDITEQKAIEREREMLLTRERDMRAEAQKASRIKDEFLATVSHELRTPLNAILGWATLLKRRDTKHEIGLKGIDAIERNAKAQAQLIEDLLDVSRIISGRMRLDVKPVRLTPIIRAAVESVKPAADAKQISVGVTIDRAADELRADDARLQQVMWNLLSNSIKFTQRGGKVHVRTSLRDSKAEITVTDNGEGIPQDFLPFIFDRFQQADASYTRVHGGLGLGLAITRHLIEMHGGTIEAESEGQGQGSTFKIKLPIAAVMTKSSSDSDQGKRPMRDLLDAEMTSQLSGARILAIDDSADTRDLLRIVLEQYGANVKTASSAREALVVMTHWKPDVLVCDIGMPEEDGYSFIQRVRKLKPDQGSNTPAIALTGYVRVEDRMRALEAGYQMFVPKPVEATELAALIGNLRGIV